MFRKLLTSRGMIPLLLCLQVLPLVVFPSSAYSLKSQEWWLPLLLTILTLISLVQVLIRRSIAAWPWYLLAFSQGFNIISRIMMLLPHATITVEGGGQAADGAYIAIAFAAMLFSAFEIWYSELPEVRQKLLPKTPAQSLA
jgi:hypothetical protein